MKYLGICDVACPQGIQECVIKVFSSMLTQMKPFMNVANSHVTLLYIMHY